jgi:purine nucleoside permease
MTLLRFIIRFVSLIAVLQTASAAEWRYCLAPSNDDHKVYFSGAFTNSADAWITDSAFEQVLIHAGLRYDDVQCPRADDENAILAMLRDAVAYNRTNGRKIIYVRWEPTRSR